MSLQCISPSEWHQYFANLLFNNNERLLNPTSGNDHEHAEESADLLNEPITLEEVIRSVSQLPVGKSTTAEFFKTTIHDIAPILLLLFNQILQTGSIPTS